MKGSCIVGIQKILLTIFLLIVYVATSKSASLFQPSNVILPCPNDVVNCASKIPFMEGRCYSADSCPANFVCCQHSCFTNYICQPSTNLQFNNMCVSPIHNEHQYDNLRCNSDSKCPNGYFCGTHSCFSFSVCVKP